MILCSVFAVKINFVSLSDNFAVVVLATCTTNVVWALELTTVRAFSRVTRYKRVMGAALAPA